MATVAPLVAHAGAPAAVALQLFEDVNNMGAVLDVALNDATLPVALLDPALVMDPLQVLCAAEQATLANPMRTKSLSTELIYTLSASTNISQSLKTFGVTAQSRAVLACLFDPTEEQLARLASLVEGSAVPLADVGRFCDLERVQKTYKVTAAEDPLLDAVLTRIAARGV